MRPMPPLTELVAAFYKIDELLFPKESYEFNRRTNSHHHPQTFKELREDCHGIFYLSDGGYSRIYVDYMDAGIFWLGSESTEKAKDRWESPEVREARKVLKETLLKLQKQYIEENA